MTIPNTRSAKTGPMDAGFLAPLIADFAAALEALDHTGLTIRGYTDSARHFAAWACDAGLRLGDISKATVDRFASHDCRCAGIRRWRGISRKYARRAGRFVGFLVQRGWSRQRRARPRSPSLRSSWTTNDGSGSSRPVRLVGLAARAHDQPLITGTR